MAIVDGTSAPSAAGPSLPIRLFVYGFLSVFAVAAVLGIEWWPLTSWKLFSQLRTGTAYGWEVVTVDAAGTEHALDTGALPRGFRGVLQVAEGFPGMSEAERAAVCAAWAAGALAAGADVAQVRVYRTRTPVRTDFDDPPPPSERTERFDCP